MQAQNQTVCLKLNNTIEYEAIQSFRIGYRLKFTSTTVTLQGKKGDGLTIHTMNYICMRANASPT